MSRLSFDLITVFHNETNHWQAIELQSEISVTEVGMPYTFIGVDNRIENRGFAKGCNYGARQGTGDIIGFLNPDVEVLGWFLMTVAREFTRDPQLCITGERFGKPQRELRDWGVRDWVCGAAMFVRRSWFEQLGGFDERYVWGWEETDFIRRTEAAGGAVRSITLPLAHSSPSDDNEADAAYKRLHFENGKKLYREKWGMR